MRDPVIAIADIASREITRIGIVFWKVYTLKFFAPWSTGNRISHFLVQPMKKLVSVLTDVSGDLGFRQYPVKPDSLVNGVDQSSERDQGEDHEQWILGY